jgi:hypothetical protein
MDQFAQIVLHIDPTAFASYYQDSESNPSKFGIYLGIEENGVGKIMFHGPLLYATAEEAEQQANLLLKEIRCEG